MTGTADVFPFQPLVGWDSTPSIWSRTQSRVVCHAQQRALPVRPETLTGRFNKSLKLRPAQRPRLPLAR